MQSPRTLVAFQDQFPDEELGFGSWAFSFWLVTRRASRRFSFRRARGWGATRLCASSKLFGLEMPQTGQFCFL